MILTRIKNSLSLRAQYGRVGWLCLTWGSLGLGAVGAVLPLLPTTPFVLLAAWAAPKGSPKLAQWIERHPRFGPAIQAWRSEGAVPQRAKAVAVVLMVLSWSLLWLKGVPFIGLLATGLLFVGVGAFLITRPVPTCRNYPYE